MDIFNSHMSGCTPIQPCKNCQAVSHLRSALSTANFTQLLEILEVTTPQKIDSELAARRVDEIEFDTRVANFLSSEGIETLGELIQKSEAELLRSPNFGRKSLNQIKIVLEDLGLSLRAE